GVHARHAQVGEDDRERPLLAQRLQAGLAADRGDHLEGPAQGELETVKDVGLVVDAKDSGLGLGAGHADPFWRARRRQIGSRSAAPNDARYVSSTGAPASLARLSAA